jgi:hypothetical protein
MKFVRFCFIALVVFIAMNHLSWTQEAVGGTIGGTVVDRHGRPIKDAKVTAKNVDTERKVTCNTDVHGAYKLSELPAGNYKVIVEKDGYMFYMYIDVIVKIGETVKLNTKLEPPPPPFID